MMTMTPGLPHLVAPAGAAALLAGLPQAAHDVVQVGLGVLVGRPHHRTPHALQHGMVAGHLGV